MTSDTALSRILNWFCTDLETDKKETKSGPEFDIGFGSKSGERISFEEIAKELPARYEVVDHNGLPPLEERAVISKEMRFYDLFQILEVSEDQADRLKLSEGIGWYWATYFGIPISGFAHVGPFSSERAALLDAASKALPINDPRRSEYVYGLMNDGKTSVKAVYGKLPS